MACTKRKFTSEGQARRAHRQASYRIRAYYCPDCRAYHVTNNEKRTNWHEKPHR